MGKGQEHSARGIGGSKREGESRVGESESSARHSSTDSTGEPAHEILLCHERIPAGKDDARAK